MKVSPAFKRLNQVLMAMHPIRFKILLALYLSELKVVHKKRNGKVNK